MVTSGNKWQSEITTAVMSVLPRGFRQFFLSTTFAFNEELMVDAANIFIQGMDEVTKLQGVTPFFILQVISTSQLRPMSRAGGNALGLGDATEPLVMVLGGAMWTEAQHDQAVRQALSSAIGRAQELAKSKGLFHPYEYMNYANKFQDPISGYGAASKDRLLAIAQKYDPDGVFQRLQPGSFKLQHKGPIA